MISHKALVEAELEAQRAEMMKKLEKGNIVEGTVKNITSYGVFVDLAVLTVSFTLLTFLGVESTTRKR